MLLEFNYKLQTMVVIMFELTSAGKLITCSKSS